MLIIGIDLGGTHLRLASVSQGGRINLQRKVVVGSPRSPQKIVRHLTQQVQFLKEEANERGFSLVGIGVPGIVSERKGIVYASPHYPQWKNFNLARILGQKLKLPVFIDNDANMVAQGELWKGAGRGWDSFIMITLGTGIGGALVINKKVFHGDNGFAGEIGHMVIEEDGPRCACGSHGCWETFASATGMARMLKEKNGNFVGAYRDTPLLAKHLANAAANGNRLARKIFNDFGYYLGIGLASLVNITGIQRVVLGGGVTGASNFFLPTAWKEIKRRTYAKTFSGLRIRTAQLGDEAGILGSARMAWENFSKRSR